MGSLDTQPVEVERKAVSILKVLGESPTPLGATLVAERLRAMGIQLSDSAVSYHLRLMDVRGLTRLVPGRGRRLSPDGRQELESALVRDRIGLALSRMESLTVRADFDPHRRTGTVPINVSFFPGEGIGNAIRKMLPAFEAGSCVSDLAALRPAGAQCGGLLVPSGKVALATVCSVVFNAVLLRAGVPVDSKFSGILQIEQGQPVRFVDLIQYSGSSLDPAEVFIRAGMTSVSSALQEGSGRLLASYREIPAVSGAIAEDAVASLRSAGIGGLVAMGRPGESVCEVPTEPNRIGVILYGGLNPIAALHEDGLTVETHAMSAVMGYEELSPIGSLVET
jgi:repressor of nif and glnA expression